MSYAKIVILPLKHFNITISNNQIKETDNTI